MKMKSRRLTGGTRLFVFLSLLAILCAVSSCNVTRTTTTESRYYQRGDTTVQITTKVVESYDASKKLPY